MDDAIIRKCKQIVEYIRSETERTGFTWQTFVVVLWVSLVLTVSYYVPNKWYYMMLKGMFGKDVARYVTYIWLDYTFMLKVFGSMLIITLVFREPLKSYGLGLGDWRLGLKLCLVCYILYAPLAVIFFTSKGFQEHYGAITRNIPTWQVFFLKENFSVLFFMIATEFFFRGFLLFGISKRHGEFMGMMVSIIPFVMWHYNKPAIETFGSFPVGLALAYVALRTESIWYSVLLHWSIALFLNGLVLAFHG